MTTPGGNSKKSSSRERSSGPTAAWATLRNCSACIGIRGPARWLNTRSRVGDLDKSQAPSSKSQRTPKSKIPNQFPNQLPSRLALVWALVLGIELGFGSWEVRWDLEAWSLGFSTLPFRLLDN